MAKVVRSETQDVRHESSSGRVVQFRRYYRRSLAPNRYAAAGNYIRT
jgi:hypothetical protein